MMRKRGEGGGEMANALGVTDVSSIIKCRWCTLGVGDVSSVSKCRGCLAEDGFLHLQFNTSKRILKVVRWEGNRMTREEVGVVMRNCRTAIGRPQPPEGNPMMSEEARAQDGEPVAWRNGRNRKVAMVVQNIGSLTAVVFEVRSATYILEPWKPGRWHHKRKWKFGQPVWKLKTYDVGHIDVSTTRRGSVWLVVWSSQVNERWVPVFCGLTTQWMTV
jgi:hypothetical protein